MNWVVASKYPFQSAKNPLKTNSPQIPLFWLIRFDDRQTGGVCLIRVTRRELYTRLSHRSFSVSINWWWNPIVMMMKFHCNSREREMKREERKKNGEKNSIKDKNERNEMFYKNFNAYRVYWMGLRRKYKVRKHIFCHSVNSACVLNGMTWKSNKKMKREKKVLRRFHCYSCIQRLQQQQQQQDQHQNNEWRRQ